MSNAKDIDYQNMSLSEKEKNFYTRDYKNNEDYKYKICTSFMQRNVFDECEREQMVSYYQMVPLIKKAVPIEEADYIIYGHPFARVEDFTTHILNQLEYINSKRNKNAEIIIVGKATNIKKEIDGKYDNITYVDSHFTEYLGKRFDIDMKEEYFVYDDREEDGKLNFWPVDGCLNKCGFCRRTYMDIKFESLSLEYIKEKLDWYKLNKPEYMKCVNIRAENLTEYGIDIYGKPMLDKLIDLVSSYDEIEKIRLPFGMCIGEITPEILDALCRCKKLRHIALNLEAGSDRLLKLINKKHTRDYAIYVYNKIIQYHPDIFINCTVMIGLPTEGLDDILQLADLLAKTQPNNVLCNFYGYSSKHPIAKYQQLDPNVRDYHLKFLIQLLKEQDREVVLRFNHEKIYIKNKRKDERMKKALAKQQQYFIPRILDYEVKYFCGNIILSDEEKEEIDGKIYTKK